MPIVTSLFELRSTSADLFILVMISSALSIMTPSLTRLNCAARRSFSPKTPCKFSTLKRTELSKLLTSQRSL